MAIDINKITVKCPLCGESMLIGKLRKIDCKCPECQKVLNTKYGMDVILDVLEELAKSLDTGTVSTIVEDDSREAQFEKKLERARKSLCPECGHWLSDTLVVGKNALVAHCKRCGTEVVSV